MIIILCGQDFFASRRRLAEIKISSKASEKITFSAKNLELEILQKEISSLTLFSDHKLLIIENFFQQKKIPFKIFEGLSDSIELVLWESTDLPRGVGFGEDVQIISFKPKQIIFKYIDSLVPRNRKLALSLLFKAFFENLEETVIFYFVVRHLRLLMFSKLKDSKSLFATENQGDWLFNKYGAQSKKFDLSKLKRIYELLYEADFRLKTGRLESLKQPLFWATYQLTA